LNTIRTCSKRLEIRFDLPLTSSDGGLLLLRKADGLIGLTSRLAACLKDRRRDPHHTLGKMLFQRVLGICQGWEDCNDFDALQADPLYRVVLGSKPATQPTLSRFENGVGRRELYAMSVALVENFIERHRVQTPKRIVIDMDATDDPAHGQQELEFYHGFYGHHCFLPLLGFCSVDGGDEELVGAILRPGNVHAGRRSAAILRRLVRKLRTAFPKVEIVFRADAGFALPEVYETCEKLEILYLISLAKNSRLLEMAAPLIVESRVQKEASGEKSRLFGEILYAAGTWTKQRRVIVKAEVMEKGENPRFVVTNLPGAPEELYDDYCRRGDCENRIKELKLDLASGRTSCHKFTANCFRLLLHAAAFVLLSAVRRMLQGTGLARSTMGQIRLKILKIAAQVQTTTRRILIRLPRGHPHADLLQRLMA
jgi:DDE family transposase